MIIVIIVIMSITFFMTIIVKPVQEAQVKSDLKKQHTRQGLGSVLSGSSGCSHDALHM